ncbi:MAG: hypothetical protein HYX49_07990 [Chloroflexi bacterium]|nr:hypothetical protein [Chloroflexota bacterium]
MQTKKLVWLAMIAFATISLAGCNIGKTPEPTPDVNSIYTAAAGTMIVQLNSQLTQTAQAVPPTPIPSPTTTLPVFTSLPTFPVAGTTPFVFNTPGGPTLPATPFSSGGGSSAVGCNNSAFVSETVPDGTIFTTGKNFAKVWSLQNSGTCAWDIGYSFSFVSGDRMAGNDITIAASKDVTAAGRGQAFKVNLTAPSTPGNYKGFWRMKDNKGTFFGAQVWVAIVVK